MYRPKEGWINLLSHYSRTFAWCLTYDAKAEIMKYRYLLLGKVKNNINKKLNPAKQNYAKSRDEHEQVNTTQSAFTCTKLIIETLEQGVQYVQSYQ